MPHCRVQLAADVCKSLIFQELDLSQEVFLIRDARIVFTCEEENRKLFVCRSLGEEGLPFAGIVGV